MRHNKRGGRAEIRFCAPESEAPCKGKVLKCTAALLELAHATI